MTFSAQLKNKTVSFFRNELCLCFCFVVMAMILCAMTQNENMYDFLNYHYYNPFAFLHGRMNYDIVPASLHTFFNPLIDLPFYAAIELSGGNPAISHAIQGIWFGLLLFAFYKFVTLFFDTRNATGRLLTALTVILAASGSVTWFQAGSSTNETAMTFFMFWGLYRLVKLIKFPDKQKPVRFFWCGMIFGAALGLKPTVLVNCLAAGLTLILLFKYLKQPFRAVLYFVLGGLAGYLVVNGWFMWQMGHLYGNPFFPFLNGWFKSPYFDNFNYSDRRTIPSLKLFPIIPYLWGHKDKILVLEKNVSLTHLKVFYTLLLCFLAYMITRPKQIKLFFTEHRLWAFLFVFAFLNYLLWTAVFSIFRYFMVVEMIGSLFLMQTMVALTPRRPRMKKAFRVGCILLYGALFANIFLSPSWGNRKEMKKVMAVEKVNFPPNTLLKLYGFPTAGFIPVFAKNAEFKALGYHHVDYFFMRGTDFVERGEFRRIRDKIVAEHTGPVIVLFNTFYANHPSLRKDLQHDTEGMFCRRLNADLPTFHFTICVPPELKDEILTE